MQRIGSALSDTSDADESYLHGEREAELQRLQVEYRICSGDRSAFVEESMNQLSKDKAEIDRLAHEKEELIKLLNLAKSRSNRTQDRKNRKRLTKLSGTMDELNSEIDEERNHHVELDTKIRDWERKVSAQHLQAGDSQASAVHSVKTQKKIRSLNNRLEFALQSYNSVLTENAALREEIDKLRVERLCFDDIHRQLSGTLEKIKLEKFTATEDAVRFYDQRDEANSKCILLQEKSKKDKEQHEGDMKELLRVIHHDKILKDFMNFKTADRPEDPQLVSWKAKKVKEAEEKRIAAANFVESYKTAFTRIQQLSGEPDLFKLVENFIEKEDDNFSLFTFVNGQNNVIEVLKNDIEAIEEAIDLFKREAVKLEEERREILEELENERLENCRAADKNVEMLTLVNKKLDMLVAGVKSIFYKSGCDVSSLEVVLGYTEEGVNTRTLMQHLGLVEHRANQLLTVQNYAATKNPELKLEPVGVLLGDGPGQHPSSAILVPPSIEEDFGDDHVSSSDERPLSREVLRKRAINTVKKKESEARKDTFLYLTGGSKHHHKKK